MTQWFTSAAVLGTALVLTTSATTRAGMVLTAKQVGEDVVIEGGGSLDTHAMTLLKSGQAYSNPSGGVVNPSASIVGFAPSPPTSGLLDIYQGIVEIPHDFGSGGQTQADVNGADNVIFDVVADPLSGETLLFVPSGYSGGDLTLSMTFTDTTIAALGMTPGTYIWSWGAKADGDYDSVVLTVGAAPEPSSLVLAGIGACAALVAGRRRRPRDA